MSYSYDYLQAHIADRYAEADQRRTVAALKRRQGARWPALGRRRRDREGLGGCTD